jgi:Uma2 family endonuclease
MAITERSVASLSEPPSRPAAIPPLENGDRLTRPEFERRYDAMPGLKKAELIEGVVYVPSPVSHTNHGGPHFQIIGWLSMYGMATPEVQGGDNSSLRLDLDNEPQPDAFLMIPSDHGGQTEIDPDGYIASAPELIVEVAASSVSYDLHDKLNTYRRHGVPEYVVWRVRDQAIDWLILHEGNYKRLSPDANGIYKSHVFPGLWLDPAALLRGDLATVAQVLQQGLASPEHAAFVARLQEKAAGNG